ncbi:MAG: hypothetical protein ACW976_06340, partial [Candidatus Ranarchaeia archaeon]
LTFRFARWFFATKVRRRLKNYQPHEFHYWELSKNWMTPKKFTLVLKEMGFTDVEQRESHYNPFEVRFIAVKK